MTLHWIRVFTSSLGVVGYTSGSAGTSAEGLKTCCSCGINLLGCLYPINTQVYILLWDREEYCCACIQWRTCMTI